MRIRSISLAAAMLSMSVSLAGCDVPALFGSLARLFNGLALASYAKTHSNAPAKPRPAPATTRDPNVTPKTQETPPAERRAPGPAGPSTSGPAKPGNTTAPSAGVSIRTMSKRIFLIAKRKGIHWNEILPLRAFATEQNVQWIDPVIGAMEFLAANEQVAGTSWWLGPADSMKIATTIYNALFESKSPEEVSKTFVQNYQSAGLEGRVRDEVTKQLGIGPLPPTEVVKVFKALMQRARRNFDEEKPASVLTGPGI